MPATFPSELLQPSLLDGVTVLVAGVAEDTALDGARGSVAAAVHQACSALGADVRTCSLPTGWSALAVGEAEVEQALDAQGSVELLVVDCAGLFAGAAGVDRIGEHAPDSGHGARMTLIACLDATWNVTRALANRAFLPQQRGGRIVYVAPAPGAGEHADAARAGLENLARTLSIEWARHSVSAVAIAPGDGTSADELAALSAYLASPAGAYFSGCLLDLRGPGGAGSG